MQQSILPHINDPRSIKTPVRTNEIWSNFRIRGHEGTL